MKLKIFNIGSPRSVMRQFYKTLHSKKFKYKALECIGVMFLTGLLLLIALSLMY